MLEAMIQRLASKYRKLSQKLCNLAAEYKWTFEDGIWSLKIPEDKHHVPHRLTLEYFPEKPRIIKPFTNQERDKYRLNPVMHGPDRDAQIDAKLSVECVTSLGEYHLDYEALFSKGEFIYGINTTIDNLPRDFRTIAGFMECIRYRFDIDRGVRQFQRFFEESNLPPNERGSIKSLLDYKSEHRY